MDHDQRITYFAETDYRGRRERFGVKARDRTQHVYVIGKTGTGKSTMLENMVVQDIQNGEGFAFMDPHGKSADLLLDYIPEHRIDDVLYFAPFDTEYPIAFNVMEDVGVGRRHLVASGLLSVFKKIWVDGFSSRMEHMLNNTILALLEYPGSTLLGINRMFVDKNFRKAVVDSVTDPGVKSFWVDEFAKYTDRFAQEATPAIQNKIGQFTTNPIIRNIIGQPRSSFDVRDMMDKKKIIIINLSKGQVGESNASLLGSLLITKIYLAALSRADVSPQELEKLPNFYLFVDEFQSFANESFADILSEARKYKLNLTMAHQYMDQMSDEVRSAVIGNVGTMITFRVGGSDAEILETEFSPQFTIEDFVSLGFAQIYLKLMVDGLASKPFSARTLPPIPLPEVSYRDKVVARSREQFGRPCKEVEDEVITWHHQQNFTAVPRKDTQTNTTKEPHPAPRGSTAHTNEASAQKTKKETHPPDNPGGALKQKKAHNDQELSQLKNKQKNQPAKNKKKKGPSRERLGELREALASVMKNQEKTKDPHPKPNNTRPTPHNAPPTPNPPSPSASVKNSGETQKASARHSSQHPKAEEKKPTPSTQTPKEVPEDVLRKVLNGGG